MSSMPSNVAAHATATSAPDHPVWFHRHCPAPRLVTAPRSPSRATRCAAPSARPPPLFSGHARTASIPRVSPSSPVTLTFSFVLGVVCPGVPTGSSAGRGASAPYVTSPLLALGGGGGAGVCTVFRPHPCMHATPSFHSIGPFCSRVLSPDCSTPQLYIRPTPGGCLPPP